MKLHRFGLIASAIVAFAFCANAQLLWKISGNGLNKPSFVIGTHHIAPASMLDTSKALKNQNAPSRNSSYPAIENTIFTARWHP